MFTTAPLSGEPLALSVTVTVKAPRRAFSSSTASVSATLSWYGSRGVQARRTSPSETPIHVLVRRSASTSHQASDSGFRRYWLLEASVSRDPRLAAIAAG